MVRSGKGFVALQQLAVCLVLLLAVACEAPAQDQSDNPRLSLPHSHLDPPFQAPVFVAGHVAMAAGGVAEGLQNGAGAVFLFRPGAAYRFLDFLYDVNSSLVLQAEYHRVNEEQRILSGDMIFRRYLKDYSSPAPPSSFFLGLGIGASEVTLAVVDGGGFETGWEYLAEAGQEFNLRSDLFCYWQLQYRSYLYNGHDFSHWSLKLGAGIPIPW